MLEGRRLKDRKSPGQFEARGNIDNRNRQLRNDGSTRNPNSIVGLSKVNTTTTRIPKKIDTLSSAPPVVSSSSSHQHQPLSVPLSSTISVSSSVPTPCNTNTKTTNPTSELTPEIYFLIREHAKTLEAISKITNRVDKLEHKIEDICRKVKQIDKYNNENRGSSGGGSSAIKKGESSASSGITPNALSDDSGVEYSRTTNGTGHDDDELLSLLNQITKFSDSIKQTLTQPNCNLHSPTIPRPDHYLHHPPPPPPPSTPPHLHPPTHPLPHPHHHHLIAPTETGSMVFGLTGSSSSTASSTLKQSVHNINGVIRHHQQSQPLPPGTLTQTPQLPPSSATRKNLSSSMDISRHPECPDPTSAPQSFSALLFESNVEHFLANLDFVPEPVRTSDYYYPPSMPITPPSPPNLLHQHQHQHQQHQHQQHHHQHQHSHSHQLQHHQPVKSHPIPASRLLTETLHHPHEQPDQQ